MKIAFFSPHLGLRGTEVTMYSFARHNETVLGNESIVLHLKNHPVNDPTAAERFKARFKVISIDADGSEPRDLISSKIDEVLESEGCDVFYMQKKGDKDGFLPTKSKTCILCCGIVDPAKERHGDRYAFVSDWLSKVCSNGSTPAVPSIVEMPEPNGDLRKDLDLPSEAIIFGRNGGLDTWNIPFTDIVIREVLKQRSDIYFLFQNTPHFHDHQNIIHIPAIADVEYKAKFINSCDAMIHSRYEGESFGLACGEFSLMNKPIITFGDSRERSHIEILGEKGIYYRNPQELYNVLMSFNKQPEKDWNCYRQFNPRAVMNIFNEVFLK